MEQRLQESFALRSKVAHVFLECVEPRDVDASVLVIPATHVGHKSLEAQLLLSCEFPVGVHGLGHVADCLTQSVTAMRTS